jgi:hypothetical protein
MDNLRRCFLLYLVKWYINQIILFLIVVVVAPLALTVAVSSVPIVITRADWANEPNNTHWNATLLRLPNTPYAVRTKHRHSRCACDCYSLQLQERRDDPWGPLGGVKSSMDRDDNRSRWPWLLCLQDAVEEGMNYESSAEDWKFDNRCRRQNRGPYLEDKCREHNIIEEIIVDIGNIWTKLKNVTSVQLSACLEYYVTDCRYVNPLLAKSL